MTLHCVYRAYDADGALLYVGCTSNLPRRMRQWSRSSAAWTWQVCALTKRYYVDRHRALMAERSAIWREAPQANIQNNHEAKVTDDPSTAAWLARLLIPREAVAS